MPEPAAIFISYRRDDAAGHARALALALNPVFGAEHVFIDADDMRPGEDFETRLGRAVRAARVMLVLIGPRWRGEREDGAARLFDAQDFVRLEVATALAAGHTQVLPLLLDGTPMPQAAQLPPELQDLTRLHALPLAHAHYDADITRLVQALQAWVPPLPQRGRLPRRGVLVAAGAALAVGAGTWVALGGGRASAPAQATTDRTRINGLWQAEVPYAWLPAPRPERMRFGGEGAQLLGAVSFLGLDRTIQEGRYSAERGLEFFTTSVEVMGEVQRELRHRYHGVPQADGIAFEMQTEGGHDPQPLLRFVARPAAPADGVR
jgi:hypothetical protein